MLSEYDVVLSEFSQGRHLLLIARIVQAIDGNQQHVLTAPHVAIFQIAQGILHADRFRITLFDQTTLILLRVQQTVFFKETTCRHRIGERQIRALHGNRAVEVRICPDIHQVRTDK